MITLSLTSVSYLLFILAALVIYYKVDRKSQWVVLLGSSLIFFYICSGIYSIPWLLTDALITYFGARMIEKQKERKKETIKECSEDRLKENKEGREKQILIFVIVLVIAQLWMLKYLPTMGIFRVKSRIFNLMCPIAISFYSLSIIGYVLDVYWGIVKAQKSFWKYLLFVCYFPQMTSGPITRYQAVSEQFEKGADFSYEKVRDGLIRVLYGIFKKCVIADQAAMVVNTIFGDTITYQGFYIIVGAIFFSLQLYADFSGCMDIVLGTSICFGVELPENFNLPFSSLTMAEFWRRWHITLGVWFKDYVMYPLLKSGPFQKLNKKSIAKYGRKKGKKIPTYLALLVVWGLIGYWHGGALHYCIGSGFLHYFYIVGGEQIEPLIAKWCKKLSINRTTPFYTFLRRLKVFLLVTSGFIFFRSETTRAAVKMFYRMIIPFNRGFLEGFSLKGLGPDLFGYVFLLIGCLVMWTVSWLKAKDKNVLTLLAGQNKTVRWIIYFILAFCITLAIFRNFGLDAGYFIYNKF